MHLIHFVINISQKCMSTVVYDGRWAARADGRRRGSRARHPVLCVRRGSRKHLYSSTCVDVSEVLRSRPLAVSWYSPRALIVSLSAHQGNAVHTQSEAFVHSRSALSRHAVQHAAIPPLSNQPQHDTLRYENACSTLRKLVISQRSLLLAARTKS